MVRREISFKNYLLTHRVSLNSVDSVVSVELSSFKAVPTIPQRALQIQLSIKEYQFSFALSLSDTSNLLRDYFGDVLLEALPVLLIKAALIKFVSKFNDVIISQYGASLQVDNVSIEAGEQKTGKYGLCAELTLNDFNFPVYMVFPDTGSNSVGRHFYKNFSQPEVNPEFDLNLSTVLSFGYTLLSIRMIGNLKSGDVIFFDQCYFKNGQDLKLVIERKVAWVVRLKQNTIELVKPWSLIVNENFVNESELMEPDEPLLADNENVDNSDVIDCDEDAVSINTSEIQLPVTFEMTEHLLPVSDVQAMKAGYVFDLQAEPNSAIHIKVNNKRLALGELVKVGDKLGVRITQIKSS